MDFPRSRPLVPELELLAQATSTNDILASSVAGRPHLSTVVTLDQTAGHGRLGRSWVTPPGEALAVSVLLRPFDRLPTDSLGWITLCAGLAMTRAVQSLLPERRVALKWPNDVHVDGRKVCGVLAQLLPGSTIVVGAGLNLTIDEDKLPVPTATSLRIGGATGEAKELADQALAVYLRELQRLWDRLINARGDADISGIRREVTEACSTIGRPVRVNLPDGSDLHGKATALDAFGHLELSTDPDGASQTVTAGDVTHLRYE